MDARISTNKQLTNQPTNEPTIPSHTTAAKTKWLASEKKSNNIVIEKEYCEIKFKGRQWKVIIFPHFKWWYHYNFMVWRKKSSHTVIIASTALRCLRPATTIKWNWFHSSSLLPCSFSVSGMVVDVSYMYCWMKFVNSMLYYIIFT